MTGSRSIASAQVSVTKDRNRCKSGVYRAEDLSQANGSFRALNPI